MPPLAIGGMLVRPISTAPPARSRAMVKASSLATRCSKAGEPAATVRPRDLVAVLGGVGDAVERAERGAVAAAPVGSGGLLEHRWIEHGNRVEA